MNPSTLSTSQKNPSLVITNAGGYTGMTVMQEIAISKRFDSAKALVSLVNANGEAMDIQNMSSSFQVKKMELTDDFLCNELKDAEVLIIIPIADASKVASTKLIIDCAQKANVKNVVLLSSVGAEVDNPALQEFKEMEQLLIDSHLNHCIVRAGYYAQALLLLADHVKKGSLPIPIEDNKLNAIDLADVGSALVRVAQGLLESSKHNGKVYTITGPTALTGNEMAEILSKNGINVEFVSKNLLSDKNKVIDKKELDYILAIYENAQESSIWQVTKDFELITGLKSTSFEIFAKKYAAELGGKVVEQ